MVGTYSVNGSVSLHPTPPLLPDVVNKVSVTVVDRLEKLEAFVEQVRAYCEHDDTIRGALAPAFEKLDR